MFSNLEKNKLPLAKVEHSSVIFESIVNKILSESLIDYKWYFYVHLFVNKIINTIRPNPNRPNEVINFNDYVTVKNIKWMNHLKCEYISGMVLDSNIADRRMKTNILNPKIIIVEGSLTFDTPKKNFMEIENILKQEKHFIKSVEKNLMTVNPNIIVYEKEVSRKIVERIRDIGYTLLMNVPKDELKRLAWLTQTIIVPSIDFLVDNFR